MNGVVVGVRQGETSGSAVRWAAAEASVRELRLSLVHVWDAPLDVSVELDPTALSELRGPATSCAIHGPVASALLAQQPAVLVLGRHEAERHLPRLTRSCLHHASCPVVVVPETERPQTGRVVVGVCGTNASNAALRWAATEARLRAAELVVVHAWQVHPASARDVLQPIRALPEQQDAAGRRVRAWVASVLGSNSVELQVGHGAPLDRLLEASSAADLIVLGRGVHTSFGHILHGAVGDDLSGLAPCPVAVIPTEASRTDSLV